MGRKIEAPGFTLPGVEDITRRDFLIGGAAALLLGGCGSESPQEVEGGGNGYPRTVRDKFGPVEIEAEPQRVMTFYASANLDAILALGARPSLIATYPGFTLLPWQGAARGVPMLLMAEGQPNVEKVLAEGIDLIVAATYPEATRENNYRTIPDPIADIPVVVLDYGDIEGQLRIVGAALGLEEEAAAKASEVEALFADFRPARVPKTVKAFGTYGDGTFYMFKSSSSLSKLLERFGLPPLSWPTEVGDQEIDPEAVQEISIEKVSELECDLLFGLGYNESPLDPLTDSPLFQQLEVVREGRFAPLGNDDSFAVAYPSVLSLPRAKEVLTRALEV